MGNPREPQLSEDGLFVWRSDLYVWEPVGQVPMGTETPDGRFRLTETGWVAQGLVQPQVNKRSARLSALRLVLAGLALVGGALVVGVVLLFAVVASSVGSPSYGGGGKGI